MLEQIAPLWPIFKTVRDRQEPLVLVTLVSTQGSSYKKPGAMMLVTADGQTHGLISGGCLEADVAAHARQVFLDHAPVRLEYDMGDDSIFGLGAGCDGHLTLLLQYLSDDYMPLAALDPTPAEAQASDLWLFIDDQVDDDLGAFVIKQGDVWIESRPDLQQQIKHHASPLHYLPPPRVTICGAGIDVIPLVQMAQLLHWHVTLVDHRQGRLDHAELASAHTIPVRFKHLDESLASHDTDAVVIMSHNLEYDAAYLKYFAERETWLGLLGPKSRRDKVLQAAELVNSEVIQRLHAPVGLDIGGHMPEHIAVAVIAQLQQHFQSR